METADEELNKIVRYIKRWHKKDADMTEQEKEDSRVYFKAMNDHYCKSTERTLVSLCDELYKEATTPHYRTMYKNLIKGFLDIYASLNECESFSEESLKFFESRLKDD
jgi:hypothetical protein